MQIETRIADASVFLTLLGRMASSDLVANARSCVQTNVQYFCEYYSAQNQPDPYRHVVIYAVDSDAESRIVAYRYFLMSGSHPQCEMFATFVDSEYRGAGLAKSLILKSFEIGIASGFDQFSVRMSAPETPEKDGLFRWYVQYADANADRFKLRISYTGEKFRW